MSHDNHTTDNSIREFEKDFVTLDLLRRMAEGWEDPFPAPVVEQVKVLDGRTFNIVRDDLPEVGSKGRFGSLLMQRMREDTIVYVAPRVGWAPISLAKLAKMYNKRLILFAPASKTPSLHQQVAMELGADMRFFRVAAMPNLQAKAEEFALKHGYFFAPLGLRHPLITAAIVATVERLKPKPKRGTQGQMWCAMSTGVLSRGLQIALPKWEHHGVAVARNIKAGERGNAIIHSHPFPFTTDEMNAFQPPFPSARNYDAKVWRYMTGYGPHGSETSKGLAVDGAWMWNVAGEIQPTKPLGPNWTKSDKGWGDNSAFKKR